MLSYNITSKLKFYVKEVQMKKESCFCAIYYTHLLNPILWQSLELEKTPHQVLEELEW